MNILSADAILRLFAEGRRRSPLARTAMAIAAADGETAPLELTAGELEARLLSIREATFGASMEGVATCPACGEACETVLRTTDVLALPPGHEPVAIEHGPWRVEARLPRGDDVASAMHLRDPDAIRAAILARCVIASNVDPLPPELMERVEEALAAADPRADVRLALTCPACAHEWQLRFDAVAFLWSEIGASSERLLEDVDVLARAYGWSEQDILAMSATRRALYVERIRS